VLTVELAVYGGLSASTVGRLKEAWSEEHVRWSRRDLSAKRYVYFWADGIHVQARLEDDAQCLLVIIGATPEGKKELVAAKRSNFGHAKERRAGNFSRPLPAWTRCR
jgi:transposase-like protein